MIVKHYWKMAIAWCRSMKAIKHMDLAWCGLDQVHAAHDVGDGHIGIIYCASELVGIQAVAAAYDESAFMLIEAKTLSALKAVVKAKHIRRYR